jgi:hypothetical protein
MMQELHHTSGGAGNRDDYKLPHILAANRVVAGSQVFTALYALSSLPDWVPGYFPAMEIGIRCVP